VLAAFSEPWSNGQMYGRAKLDLLRARLIGA
jgi:transposase